MKKFFSKYRIITIVLCVLLSVAACAGVSRLTDGFENWDPTEIFSKDLNEENLLFEKYEDFENIEEEAYSVKLKNGVFTIDGTIANEDGAVKEIEFATVTLVPGTYTYTCFEDPSSDSCLSYVEYVDESGSVRLILDADSDSKIVLDEGLTEYQTFTITKETECVFKLRFVCDYEFDNVKAMPCLVEGKLAGDFYK